MGKQIKVQHVRKTNDRNRPLVADGIFKVVKMHYDGDGIFDHTLFRTKEGKLFINDIDNPAELAKEYDPVILMVISETEKVERGDWFDHGDGFEQANVIDGNFVNGFILSECKKILVKGNDISITSIDAAIKGKLNDGDKVEIECFDDGQEEWLGDNETGEPFWQENYKIKLHPSSGRALVLKAEEKKYTEAQLIAAMQYASSNWLLGNEIEEYIAKL